MDHIDQAVYATVHESAIPAKEIARRLGMSHQILLNKANPHCETHKLSHRECLAIQLLTGNYRIHEAEAIELGVLETKAEQKNLLESVLRAAKENGDVIRVVTDALEDGTVSEREKSVCLTEIEESIDALMAVKKAVVAHQ